MEHQNNQYGGPGGSGNPQRQPAGPSTGQPGGGATSSTGSSQSTARAAGSGASSVFPPRLYSFRALVAMGLLGFIVGRICR
ncbi:hypothetical protein [Ancylobacter sp. IITR112]|uniref:hypothetical protein n=1 Tax=Ancylobacter sp. IITR112 TaxID=3138073 RepID=UPI00352AA48C